MKKIIFLDDSINYFTDPTRLQTIYGRLWDAGIPIALAITPAQVGDAGLASHNNHIRPAIAPEYRDKAQPFKLRENQMLCRYLNVMAQQRLVEICIRGYHGTYDEFNSEDDILLSQKIEEGLAELQTALPDAELKTFLMPEDKYAQTAVELLCRYGFDICAFEEKQANQQQAISDDCQLFTYSLPFFLPDIAPEKCLKIAHEQLENQAFLIIRQPNWAFYYDWQQSPTALKNAWDSFIDELLLLKDVEIDTFAFI